MCPGRGGLSPRMGAPSVGLGGVQPNTTGGDDGHHQSFKVLPALGSLGKVCYLSELQPRVAIPAWLRYKPVANSGKGGPFLAPYWKLEAPPGARTRCGDFGGEEG